MLSGVNEHRVLSEAFLLAKSLNGTARQLLQVVSAQVELQQGVGRQDEADLAFEKRALR